MEKKKISWITADCFADCDFVYSVMDKLCDTYSIRWIIVRGTNPRYKDCEYSIFNTIQDLEILFVENSYRQRDPRSIIPYYRAYKLAKAFKPSVFYFNIAPSLFYPFVTMLYDKKRSIYVAHDGAPQSDSVKNVMIHTWAFNHTYKYAHWVNMFSKAQANLYAEHYPKGKIHLMHLGLKNFGTPTITKPKEIIRFLSVGYIIYQKNIDLLIEAGNILYEKGYRNIKISINGACEDWNFYQKKINYPEIFECHPSFLKNSDLPNLYESSHYAIYPYRRVSQSGALKIAFNYNLPVVVSNIGSFKEEVEEGVNGFFFEPEKVNSLVDVMERLIINHEKDYSSLRQSMKTYTEQHYSDSAMAKSYRQLFEEVINANNNCNNK